LSQQTLRGIWAKTSTAIAIVVCCALGALSFRQVLTWRDGFTIWQQGLVNNPKSWASHATLAANYLRADRPLEALPHSRAAAELNPHYGNAFVQLGQAHAALGQFEDAESGYRRALEIEPRDVTGRIGLANLLADTKRHADAIEQYNVVLSIASRDVLAWSNLAGAYAETGNYDQAIRCYGQALSIDPDFAPARTGLRRAIDERAGAREDPDSNHRFHR
jgi:tetratricopeptide (TPR) repeat protein